MQHLHAVRTHSTSLIRRFTLSVACISLLMLSSCTQLQQMVNLAKCQFKLENAADFRVSGIDVSRIRSYSDIGLMDAAKLVYQFSQKSMPATFNLKMAVRNPKANGQTASLLKLDGKLFINGTETVMVSNPAAISIPPSDVPLMVDLPVSVDLYKFFGERGLQGLINLAAQIGGLSAEPTTLTLRARPTIDTPIGPVAYPNDIDIISTEFR
ncbi:MAG: LEA type 2 family protein [Rhizobacter sp.]|nr:LEA type 2 family protein [Chlorobiales bacterium]